MATTTAEEMAKKVNVDPKKFRAALRDAQHFWHNRYDRWTVEIGSDRHHDMLRVLQELIKSGR